MKDKTNDNKIQSFEEMKKKFEEEKQQHNNKSFDFNIDSLGGMQEIRDILDQMGIDQESFEQMLKSFDLEGLMNLENLENLSMDDVYKGMANIKDYEKKIKQEKRLYRTFNQWISFRKPYDLSTLFQIEKIKYLAENLHVETSPLDSKNDIIKKITPHLTSYVFATLQKLDIEIIARIGQIIYSDGYYVVETPMDELMELKIDYLASKLLIMRVNDNGKHALVIPKEIQDVIERINFKEIEPYNHMNHLIHKTTIAFANAYGAFPKTLLYNAIELHGKKWMDILQIDSLEEYINEQLEFSFSKSVLVNALYSNVIESEDYISHGIIEVTKNLIDIQNNNIKNYKELSMEDILLRGDEYYYEDTLSLKEISNVLIVHNQIDPFELKQLKNHIYIFSLLEFEPSLVLQILEMRYDMPLGAEYTKFLDILRNYYKNSEKWILKGHTSFEINAKSDPNIDIKKIISFDYFNNN